MAKRMKALLFSAMSLLMSVTLLVAGTYALFSDTASMHTHLQAGKLDAQLLRTGYTSKFLNLSTGYLDEKTHTDDPYLDVSTLPTDYTQADYVNVFGMSVNDRIAPLSTMSANMKLKNNGNVAFTYEIEIDPVLGDDTDLIDQLTLSVTMGGQTYMAQTGALLLRGTANEEGQLPNAWHVTPGETKDFTVSVTFTNDDAVNNAAQEDEVVFDLIVRAVQATSTPSDI